MAKAKRKVHVVTYTHWDREFRWEFERTRMRLVDCIDRLLEIMEARPEFRSFLMDGQLTLVEDYLEIRPEKRETITKLDTARQARKIQKDGRSPVAARFFAPPTINSQTTHPHIHCEIGLGWRPSDTHEPSANMSLRGAYFTTKHSRTDILNAPQ